MKRIFAFVLLSLFTIVYFSGCTEYIGGLSEGEIEFEIKYPEMDENHPMVEFYPTVMTMQIKEGDAYTHMESSFGFFETNYISRFNDRTLTHLVKIMFDKYIATVDTTSIKDEWPNIKEITHTGNSKTIAGYKCDEAIVKLADGDTEFKIYYTEKIERGGMNWDNEFNGIAGFLMEYQMERHGLVMQFTATSVIKKDVASELFENPKEGYKPISPEKMAEIIKDAQTVN